MLRSLLHYQSSALMAFATIAFSLVALTLVAHADNGSSLASSPRLSVMNIGTLSSEELMADADQLNMANNPLDEAEMSQRLMHAQWLETGMNDTEDYREGNDALGELAENAIKYYWDSLVERDHSYSRYTPVVEGSYSASQGSADFGIRLSSDTLKFGVKYAF